MKLRNTILYLVGSMAALVAPAAGWGDKFCNVQYEPKSACFQYKYKDTCNYVQDCMWHPGREICMARHAWYAHLWGREKPQKDCARVFIYPASDKNGTIVPIEVKDIPPPKDTTWDSYRYAYVGHSTADSDEFNGIVDNILNDSVKGIPEIEIDNLGCSYTQNKPANRATIKDLFQKLLQAGQKVWLSGNQLESILNVPEIGLSGFQPWYVYRFTKDGIEAETPVRCSEFFGTTCGVTGRMDKEMECGTTDSDGNRNGTKTIKCCRNWAVYRWRDPGDC